jgi:hypothetical protein
MAIEYEMTIRYQEETSTQKGGHYAVILKGDQEVAQTIIWKSKQEAIRRGADLLFLFRQNMLQEDDMPVVVYRLYEQRGRYQKALMSLQVLLDDYSTDIDRTQLLSIVEEALGLGKVENN